MWQEEAAKKSSPPEENSFNVPFGLLATHKLKARKAHTQCFNETR